MSMETSTFSVALFWRDSLSGMRFSREAYVPHMGSNIYVKQIKMSLLLSCSSAVRGVADGVVDSALAFYGLLSQIHNTELTGFLDGHVHVYASVLDSHNPVGLLRNPAVMRDYHEGRAELVSYLPKYAIQLLRVL